MIVCQFTENYSIIILLYTVNQSTCKQTILLEYKTERDSTTNATQLLQKLCFISPPGVWMMNKYIKLFSFDVGIRK